MFTFSTIPVDRSSRTPLTDQVCAGIASAIHTSSISPSQRLPSVRQLAVWLGLSNFTVAAAYERLVSQGVVVSRAGSGYYAASMSRHLQLDEPMPPPPQPDSAVNFVQNVVDPRQHALAPSTGSVPTEWMEDALPASAVGRLLRGASFSQSAPAQGLVELRKQLSVTLGTNGIMAPPAQIITTSGATHAIQLIVQHLLKPGDTVLVEDPSNMVQHAQLRDRGARLLSVPRLHDGPNLEVIDRLASEHKPRLMITQSVLHNPTGNNTSSSNCFRLLQLAEKHDFLIVEDDIFGDLHNGNAVRLAALDGLHRVLYVNSYSKLLSPAVRVGYIACAAELVAPLVERKILNALSGSALLESLVLSVLDSGRYMSHILHLRRRIGAAQSAAHAALSSAGLDAGPTLNDGLYLWASVPRHVSVDRLLAEASGQGILLTRGSMFSPTGAFERHFRFNVGHCTAPRLLDLLRGFCRPTGDTAS